MVRLPVTCPQALFKSYLLMLLLIQVFLYKSPCNVPRVLDVNNCPLHNVVHDISSFPQYYDPIYYPHFHPEIYDSPMAIKGWIEDALNSHVSACPTCFGRRVDSSVRYSVQWRESLADFFVCVILNGKLKQCLISLKDLQSPRYTHCRVLVRLFEKRHGLPPKLACVKFTAPPTNVFYIVANKEPAWLHYSEAWYCLHLTHLSLPILTATVKRLKLGSSLVYRSKEKCVSKIVDHFMLERNAYHSTYKHHFGPTPRDNIRLFVQFMEVLYGKDIATLLRETPFLISAQANRNLNFTKDSHLAWFNESTKELSRRLHSFSMHCIVSYINKIPGHRRPVLDSSSSHPKILNSLIDHILRRVSYLFSLKIASICEIVLALDPRILFEDEPCKEVLMNSVIELEYGTEVFLCLATPLFKGNDQRN